MQLLEVEGEECVIGQRELLHVFEERGVGGNGVGLRKEAGKAPAAACLG